MTSLTSHEAVIREEARDAERFAARVRLGLAPGLFLVTLGVGLASDVARAVLPAAAAISFLATGYALATVRAAERAYRPALSYATTFVDATIATALTLAVSSAVGDLGLATKSPTVLVYFIVIVVAGLRLAQGLPLFAAAVGLTQLFAMLAPVALAEPSRLTLELDDFQSRAVSVTRVAVLALTIAMTGAIVDLLVRRARDLVRRSLTTLTFMYADLRGFTSYIEEHGDEAGTALVREYRALVRRELARVGGRELKTEGDSFLAEFRTARQALGCATAVLRGADARMRERPDLPLHIGVGLHAGEPVRLEADYIGSALNVAARLGQAAAAGELLASDVVRGLLRTSGAPPAREREGLVLKGISDPPRVYAFDLR